MIRVAICDPNEQERLRLRNMLYHCASDVRAANVVADLFDSAAPLFDAIAVLREGYYDLALVRIDCEPGEEAEGAEGDTEQAGTANAVGQVSAASTAGRADPASAAGPAGVASRLAALLSSSGSTELIAMSSSAEAAVRAREMGARGFLLLPAEYDSFRATIAESLRRVALTATPTLLVKSRKGLDNVQTGEILFVETVKNGINIHLPGGETVSMRSTLQALFDKIEGLGPFVKAGSSFILNLDNVRSVGESSVIFADGEAIIVPVRARKPLKDALAGYRAGA